VDTSYFLQQLQEYSKFKPEKIKALLLTDMYAVRGTQTTVDAAVSD
jgi:hypothetical protein